MLSISLRASCRRLLSRVLRSTEKLILGTEACHACTLPSSRRGVIVGLPWLNKPLPFPSSVPRSRDRQRDQQMKQAEARIGDMVQQQLTEGKG